MNEDSSKKTKWIVAGIAGVAIVGGGVALAMTSGGPKAVEWYGYQIRVEDRSLDEEMTGGKPYRWVLAQDDTMLATGLAESRELAIDAAKSAAELAQQRGQASGTAPQPPRPSEGAAA